ncbi:PREDICTED: vacuolar protein sorting-associated protein 13B isoform X1 [Polistes dominula]|uniref:Vacuolar protein sorting-associated protein 13B isoform X1 n=2 Tax=Polistes dominula TaxID=743375 RepID=A0ABM1I6N3_POLDO|nr:PREDICTED: vacuolar protein sorting-associated protein 13B isoform X1 [Polistes dominula]XP_015175871.1 PREDICTED: vacuolar protein sorting-associated protein 13B isoform X1 [Polistes dominula]XP_015175872.1 PREDICTED: vacuolar protein sorting-associated protein 13B isoform X1 [Polistes dominula]
MFKLESYITPIILSYVEKYVKNFKPEQSQVSLWGGDASFQNLDLRLEVLEEQLNLPFKFVSGHIHELLIHVPWVKINSEPIVVTINTIECILKLKDEKSTEIRKPTMQKKKEMVQEVAPPGYIKSIITKIVNNITIHCNNLILKYVEEDIVLSVNVRFLSVQTVDDKWKPAFTDVNIFEVMLRKVITIQDLTLCLDKMDASGKIEIYQDPVLYRCSLAIRLIVNYHSNTAKRASVTRLDLHCEKMEFSMTEQQIPMLLRLASLLVALQTKQFPIGKEKSLNSETGEETGQDEISQIIGTITEAVGWGGWAWNVASTVLPIDWVTSGFADWDNDWSSQQQMAYSGHTIHLGIYIDDTILTFKVVESVKEQLFYKSRKLRYKSFLSLRLNGVLVDVILQGIEMTNVQIGLANIRLYPRGTCSCGHLEVVDGAQPPLYLTAGKVNRNYLKDSLFDNDALENNGKKRAYKEGINYHLVTVSVENLLKRSPAFVMDYVHCVQLPDDITTEKLAELGSNFEYSNFQEQRVIRYIIGDITIRLCSGIFHRIETIKQAASQYDYTPYIIPKPDPSAEELPPVTLEEFEALRENVSMVKTYLFIIKASLQLQLADHCITGLPRQRKIVENRTVPLTPAFTNDPFVSIEFDKATAHMIQPLYPFRLTACASKQTGLLPEMFEQCHQIIKMQVYGIKSQLYLTTNCHTSLMMPCFVKCSLKKLLYPQYWTHLDLICETYTFHTDSITITGTKPKLMVATSIITSLLDSTETTNPLVCSSLFSDACQDKNPIYLELLLENINYKRLSTFMMNVNEISVNSLKIFTLSDTQQAFILSGPEYDVNSETENKPLLIAVIQFPKKAPVETYPTLISLQVAELRGSLDPLFLKWLEYQVTYYELGPLCTMRQDSQLSAEGASSDTSTRKKTFPSLHESVHSSSDKDRKRSSTIVEKPKMLQNEETQKKNESKIDTEQKNLQKSGVLVRLAELYSWWSGLVLSGCIGHIVIYIPSTTMSGIGAHGIEQAKNRALEEDQHLQILSLKLPSIQIHSSNINSEQLSPYLKTFPVKLPKSMWTYRVQSFPWTLSLSEFHCYTLQGDIQQNFIKKMSLNATLALTTKTTTSQASNILTALSVCVHIDNSAIIISISEEQVVFMSSIIQKIVNILLITNNFKESNTVVPHIINENVVVFPAIPQTPSTPTQIIYPEDTTTNSTISTSRDDTITEKDNVTLTAWIQWTITKIAIKLYVTGQEIKPSLKLVMEMEDIITSLDLQPVYLKLKNKITTVTIFHYTRAPYAQNWDVGEYVGIILCGREDNLEKGDDSGFLSFTLTRAQSGNVHNRWGTYKRYKNNKKDVITEALVSTNAYISEIDIKIQMVDIILPLSILSKYMQLAKPLIHLNKKYPKVTKSNQEGIITSTLAKITSINNEFLPLIHLEFKGLRLMIPVSTPARHRLQHDLLILQLDGIRITPHAENPICRTPLRSDIYQLAAQANILNMPGSAVEDRQYQINVKGICVYSTTWKNYQMSINKRMSQSYLYTMNENPALEWNKLGNGNSLEPHFSTFPVLAKFDLCLIIAPTIKLKPDTIVCGSAVEINCITDIEITVNLDQLKLISILSNECNMLLSGDVQEIEITDVSYDKNDKSSPIPKQVTWIKQMSEEQEIDVTKDSGIDFEMSSINSTIVEKSQFSEVLILPPCEFLINCGKITFISYETQKIHVNSEYEVEMNDADEDDTGNLKQPLLYLMINQPNLYLWQQNLSQKMQISCFDMTIALGAKDAQDLRSIPSEKDFTIFIIQTKNGEPHPDTGIPPSFVTVKCEKYPGKNTHFFMDMGRPTKIHFSLSRLNQIYDINSKIMSCFIDENNTKSSMKDADDNKTMNDQLPFKCKKMYLPDLNLSTKQIVLSLKTSSDSEIIISLATLNGNISTLLRPDRIFSNISVESFIISAILNGNMKVLLKPWCYNITVCLLWESWQDVEALPQIQIQADSDSIYLDIGPDQIQIMKTVVEDCQLLLSHFQTSNVKDNSREMQVVLSTEQHYKDDLKAGAFQFIDGTGDELPFPYQVIFFTYPQQAMAWRYPQPRTLTKIHVSPVPFETSDNEGFYTDRISCVLQYWSDSHMAYQHYADFYLSETDTYRLDLPEKAPTRVVACVWRVILMMPVNNSVSKTLVSARALAACLRIDSYFNSSIIPNLQAALNIGIIHVSLYNHIDSSTYDSLLPPLHNFTVKGTIPEMQCFMSIEHKGAILVFNRWTDGSTLVDINGVISIHILDYSYLIMQEVLDPLDGKFQISLSDKIDISVMCKPFSLKLSPTITHTLSVSSYLWSASLNTENKGVIILTRYVIANDCNIPIRFGQSGTDDNVLLNTRECNFYSWRHIGNNMIRISIEANAWMWSRPFPVNTDGTHLVEFANPLVDITIFVNITSLSATQKLVTFTGQFIVSSQLIDNFEMKLVKYEADTGTKVTVSKNVYMLLGKSQPSTIVIENNRKMAMRLRFTNIPNLSWTGDIPLQPNAKLSQPWLVKVPLQERGQFFSIWVRIITQIVQEKTKILAVLSPLYMIRSHLPVPAKVQMETPSLKMLSSTIVNGRGERQQLYCPGTFEHFHQLTFQLESGICASNPYVPLSYSSVDQRKFFRRPEVEDIDNILKELESQKDEIGWPFQADDTADWIPAEQPQTHVQVKYQDAGLVSSTLLLELQPWCFILNSLGCYISLVSEDIELCQVPHYGIVTPPKLEGVFHLGVGIGDTYYTSPALQLARPDWSQSFYMPRIGGLIPVEGNIKTIVDCVSSVTIISITSSMHEDMRLVRVTSSHVIGNLTNQELCIATLAVDELSKDLKLPHDLTPYSQNILPSEDQHQATPIVQWHMLYENSNIESLVLYISLSLGHRWSCPIKIDQTMSRKCVAIPNGSTTMSVVLTIQEDKGTSYIMVHIDNHPQLLLENMCPYKLLLGQANENVDGIVLDAPHFTWICEVETGATCHYSLPCIGNRLPDTPAPTTSNILLLSALPNTYNNEAIQRKELQWSRGISLSALTNIPMDHYVRLPSYGDVKLIMHNRCYTTHITVVPISQIEVSARDIRNRLMRKEHKLKEVEIIPKNFKTLIEDNQDFLNIQYSSSSTSATSFFSAQEDVPATNSSISSSQTNLKLLIPHESSNKNHDEYQVKTINESNATVNNREGSATIYFHGITIIILKDINEIGQKTEVASLSMTDLIVTLHAKPTLVNFCICIGDLQLDNQVFDQGGFDFPVVLISQSPLTTRETFYPSNCLINNMEQIKENSLITADYIWEKNGQIIVSKELHLKIAPISAYIEDTYISHLLDYANSMIPPRFSSPTSMLKKTQPVLTSTTIYVSDYIMIDAKILSVPLRLQHFTIDPVSILLSVHTSVRLYVALDHSPLYFSTFERKNILTTTYRLGNALTMHYLSGAIFGAGWVVGSLEILGSPGGLAQALGSGLRDFVSLPFQGLLQGPWGFIVGITHGSASLMKHITAGTVNSVTKLASSVARNLDRLTLDEEHLQRQEEARRMRPQGMAQGLYQGLTGFGMSILAAVAGLAHHPLQQVLSGEATTKSLVTGVGLGLVGVVTKPLSGAAELVALTGQGLLQGAGWNSLPLPRQHPIVQYSTGNNNASIRYAWRLLPLLENCDNILHVTNADYVLQQGSNRAVTLVLTRQALLLVNIAEDSVEKILPLKELTSIDHSSESTMLCLYCPPATTQTSRALSPTEHEMDQEMRARVAEYVRTSSTGLASLSTNSDEQSDILESSTTNSEHTFTFYVCPETRNYLLSLFNIAKRQSQGSGFTVL